MDSESEYGRCTGGFAGGLPLAAGGVAAAAVLTTAPAIAGGDGGGIAFPNFQVFDAPALTEKKAGP